MKEKGKFSDAFNALNGNTLMKSLVLESSNKLKQMGVTRTEDIKRIYRSGDFLAFHDPLKLKNLEMFGIDDDAISQIIVAEVNDKTKGHDVYQFINIGNENNIKKGDILTLDPDKEGKEAGTEFDEDFIKYCIDIVKKEIPGFERLQINGVSDKDVMEALGIKTYEDVVYMSARSGGLKEQIESKIKTSEDKGSFVSKLTTEKAEVEKVVGEEQENSDEEKEGMTIEEASEVLGIEEEKLREVAGDSGKILGIRKTADIDTLSKQLGYEMSNAGSEVIMLKVAGPGIKSEGFVLNIDGSQVFSKENGDTTLITELVEDGANGDSIQDIDQAIREHDAESKKIKTIDPLTGKEVVEFAEQGNEKAIAAYENESNQLLQELTEEINRLKDEIGKTEDGNEVEKSAKFAEISEKLYAAKSRLADLQNAYGITEKDKLDSLEGQAQQYGADAETAKIEEGVMKVGKGTVAAVSSVIMDDDEFVLGSKRGDPRGEARTH